MTQRNKRPKINAEYDGYAWIKVPKHVMNEALSWADRYQELESHHVRETTFLIEKIRELAAALDECGRTEE